MAIYVGDFEGCFQRLLERGGKSAFCGEIPFLEECWMVGRFFCEVFRVWGSGTGFGGYDTCFFFGVSTQPGFSAAAGGLIWVNPRFVHLDKSTNLEEAAFQIQHLPKKGVVFCRIFWKLHRTNPKASFLVLLAVEFQKQKPHSHFSTVAQGHALQLLSL